MRESRGPEAKNRHSLLSSLPQPDNIGITASLGHLKRKKKLRFVLAMNNNDITVASQDFDIVCESSVLDRRVVCRHAERMLAQEGEERCAIVNTNRVGERYSARRAY